MGTGYEYRCPNCKYETEILLGIGLFFHRTQKRVTEQAAKGKFGVTLKQIVKHGNSVTVSPAKYLYYCEDCHVCKNDYCLNVYEELDNLKSEEIYRFIHKCPICHKEMKRTDQKPSFALKCPKCNTIMDYSGDIMWD
ncbi:MAG: hypothetical protein E7233_01795 [Lachnospiraceae bacterium]|nr:hypothetical protein [Lachnospiraceae bacterium]